MTNYKKYILYVNKERFELKLKKATKGMENEKFTENIVRYNESYYISNNRKKLLFFGREILEEWKIDLEKKYLKEKKILSELEVK